MADGARAHDPTGTAPRGAPWWASGGSPDEATDPAVDPLLAHRAARAGAEDGGPGAARDGAGREWWHEAADAIGELGRAARAAGAGGTGPGAPGPGTDDSAAHRHDPGDSAACQVCPVCAVIRAVEQARPEVVAHLGEAVRHLAAAARAVLDAHAHGVGGPGGGYEPIDLDDDGDE
ncbi:MAG: hypothetical protein ACLGIR_07235 [Actinomycetes bacterium]